MITEDKWLKIDIVNENEQLKKDNEEKANIIAKQKEEIKKKDFEINLLKKIKGE